jgi:hypothetical protein
MVGNCWPRSRSAKETNGTASRRLFVQYRLLHLCQVQVHGAGDAITAGPLFVFALPVPVAPLLQSPQQ